MSNIEPTEEQLRAAVEAYEQCETKPPIVVIARLLAEREAKLQARIDDLQERSARRLDDSTAIDALVYAIACLELQPGSERDRAVRDAMSRVINHVGAIEVRARDSATKVVGTLVAGAKAREDTLRARVAELTSHEIRLRGERHCAEAREAQHLADIKALMAKRLEDIREAARWGAGLSVVVDDHVDDTKIAADIMEEFATFDAEDELMQRLAHYDDAKDDAPASTEGGEG